MVCGENRTIHEVPAVLNELEPRKVRAVARVSSLAFWSAYVPLCSELNLCESIFASLVGLPGSAAVGEGLCFLKGSLEAVPAEEQKVRRGTRECHTSEDT
jgi:hypothetical protein